MTLSQFQRIRRFVLGAGILLAFAALLCVGSAWSEEIHEEIETIGLCLIAAGIAGRIWCTLYIGGRKAAEIVDIGPYSVTRNPLYLFSTVAAAGMGAQTGSLAIAVLFAMGCAAAFQPVIRREETYLGGVFGAPYASYVSRVPRFWPNPSLFRDAGTLQVTTSRIYRTLTDGLVFFVSIPAFEFVEYLQDHGTIAIYLHLY
ncbi:methyltransferase family protein [Aureimonas psammosilenae]|uniref:methyltransferase family protein n=1 Tax=Aureimonas psammosilenae TaxID=2495496 RepID=UPI001260624B|nr:isoprenylcysteine carboxylmethyltransferase family protein [Aureimonas psammosilenae]